MQPCASLVRMSLVGRGALPALCAAHSAALTAHPRGAAHLAGSCQAPLRRFIRQGLQLRCAAHSDSGRQAPFAAASDNYRPTDAVHSAERSRSGRVRTYCSPPSSSAASASQPSQPAEGGNSPKSSGSAVLTLPTMLTLARVAAIPVLVAGWYWSSPWSAPLCTAIFILAAITDWLDGYLARKMNQYSAFGAFLDPVADKLMVAAALVLLCTQPIMAGPLAGNTWLMPCMTLAIIGREITMSALREWAATLGPEARNAVAVNAWGKWKTACQMVSLTLLLAMRDGGSGPWLDAAGVAGPLLLCVAAYLTVWSLLLYLRQLWRFMV